MTPIRQAKRPAAQGEAYSVDETWFTVNEIAGLLKVHEQTVRAWLRDGERQGVNFSGRTGWRVREDDLRRSIEGKEGKAFVVA